MWFFSAVNNIPKIFLAMRRLGFLPLLISVMFMSLTGCDKDKETGKSAYVTNIPVRYMGDYYNLFLNKDGRSIAQISGNVSSGTVGGILSRSGENAAWTENTTVDAIVVRFINEGGEFRINGPFDFKSKDQYTVSFDSAVKQ